MHCLLEGLTKRLIFLTINKTTNEKIIKLLKNQNLLLDFSRDFSYPNLLGYKANQFLNFLLYYIYLLEDLIHDEYYSLFLDLRKILKFILVKNFSINEINNLKYYIFYFLQRYKLIFSDKEATSNFHLLLHIPESIINFGNMIYINTFFFEGYNQHICRNFWGTNNMEFILFRTFEDYNFIKNSNLFKKNKISKNFILNGLTFNTKNVKKNSYTFKNNINKIFEIFEILENDLLKIRNIENNLIDICKKEDIFKQMVVIKLKNNNIKFKEIIFPPKFLN